MLELIVLGNIPGTNINISFYDILSMILVLGLTAAYKKRHLLRVRTQQLVHVLKSSKFIKHQTA